MQSFTNQFISHQESQFIVVIQTLSCIRILGKLAQIQTARIHLQSFSFSRPKAISEIPEFTFLASFQVILMLLVRRPPFGNHRLYNTNHRKLSEKITLKALVVCVAS